jgi:hypothetical protein
MTIQPQRILFRIRALIIFFIIATALSGITAFPIETELSWLLRHPSLMPGNMKLFISKAYEGIHQTNSSYPMLAYGYDWLAFAHLVIALIFIGPLINPVKNIWVIDWAIITCIAVIPLALIAGTIRSIPFYWRMIDCSFGVFGIIPLLIVRSWIKKLERGFK